MWERKFIETERGKFELFIKGNGEPMCVTHLSSYNLFKHFSKSLKYERSPC